MENKYQEYQEALDNLITIERANTFKKIGTFYHTNSDLLQKLVDKEKPKKVGHDCLPHPTIDNDQLFDCYYCPNCDEVLDEEDRYDYCPECGQKLDWSEEDE